MQAPKMKAEHDEDEDDEDIENAYKKSRDGR